MIKVIAHRGASAYEPENTIRAFKKAIELDADGIELDVHSTKDGQLVVIHDSTLDRTTNGKGKVKNYNLSQLKKFDAGRGEKIPTLEEVIDLIKQKIDFIIELKVTGIEKDVVNLIFDKKIEDRVAIVSFWHIVPKNVKKLSPRIKTALNSSSNPINPIVLVESTKADGLNLKYNWINKELVDLLHKNKKEIVAWTVDDINDINRMISYGVDQIVTNKPDIVIKELKAKRLR